MGRIPRLRRPLEGREDQVRWISQALSCTRLVTVKGPAGTGKTPLAISYAGKLPKHDFCQLYIDVSKTAQSHNILEDIAEPLGIPADAPNLTEAIADNLRCITGLFLIDNCERRIDDVRAAIHTLLDKTEHLRIVSTSREELGIPGESILALDNKAHELAADPLLLDDDDVRHRRDLEERNNRRRFELRARILDDTYSADEVSNMLRLSKQAVLNRARAKQILGIWDANRMRFPKWQFDPENRTQVVQGFDRVLHALEVSDFAAASWLSRENPILEGRRPIDALKAGEVDRVVTEGRAVGSF
jgi:hypothetical protein